MVAFRQIGNNNGLADMRAAVPIWCQGCGRYIAQNDPHDDECSVEMVSIAHKARARARGDLSFNGYLLLYGILICVLGAAYLIWTSGLI